MALDNCGIRGILFSHDPICHRRIFAAAVTIISTADYRARANRDPTNHFGSDTMSFSYVWGTERPSIRRDRLVERYLGLDAEEKSLWEAFQAQIAAIAERRVALAAEIAQVDIMTSSGRYDASLARAAVNFGVPRADNGETEPARMPRRRGRPRKYFADSERPKRPTRAKTLAGMQRAHLGLAKRSRPRKTDNSP